MIKTKIWSIKFKKSWN